MTETPEGMELILMAWRDGDMSIGEVLESIEIRERKAFEAGQSSVYCDYESGCRIKYGTFDEYKAAQKQQTQEEK